MEQHVTSGSTPREDWPGLQQAFPVGLVEAILWLAASTLLQLGAAGLVENGVVELPPWAPDASLQMTVFAFNTLVLIGYFRFVRKARLWTLGFRLDGLVGELRFTLLAALAGAGIYVAMAGFVWLGAPLFVDNPDATLRSLLHQAAYRDPPVLFLVSVVVVYPLLEEIWYRGLLYTPMRKEWGKWMAIVLTAVLFGLAHPWPPVNQFIGGLIFAWAYEARRSLVAPVILHALGNGSLWVLGLGLEHFGI